MRATEKSDFTLLVSILNQREPWCLIGGLAVNCYVVETDTLDADVVVAASEADSIKQDLETAGFATGQLLSAINARMKGSELEIQLTTDARHQKFLLDTKLMGVLGERVPVASPGNLVRGLVWSWSDEARSPAKRRKDERDLLKLLEAYPELRSLVPEEISKQSAE